MLLLCGLFCTFGNFVEAEENAPVFFFMQSLELMQQLGQTNIFKVLWLLLLVRILILSFDRGQGEYDKRSYVLELSCAC